MSNQAQINEVAAMIREIDPATARVFLARPFYREQIAKAFRGGFRRHSEYTAKLCDLIDVVVKLDKLNRQEA